ncbi:DUF4157 domain-containing protein [Kitasatospora albolonga]
MRERETTETGVRRAAKRAPAGAVAPQERLLSLQGSLGNAAVVQLLRRASHPGAGGPGIHDTDDRGRPADPLATVQRSAVHDVLRGGGRPLDTTTRADMEARLGADFSDVRVHDDAAARASAAEVGARAYTSGSHVVLGAGGTDRHTLAHELTHVIQQRRGPVAGTDNGGGLRVSDPADRFEREAEATATRVMATPAPAHDRSHTHDHAQDGTGATAADATAVQRTVTVAGQEVADPAQLIREKELDYLVTSTGVEVLNHLRSSQADIDLTARDPEYLVLEIGRIAAMIDLIRSINTSGILGRKNLIQQQIAHTGSNDTGDSTALAVNVLDARTANGPGDVREVVESSLTDPNNGSFSVAMERPQDEDMILTEMSKLVADLSLPEEEAARYRELAEGDESIFHLLAARAQKDRLSTAQGEVVGWYTSLLQERTQDTAMAIVNRPGADVATLSPDTRSYESDVPSGVIPPGEGGFTSLVLPGWFRPYASLVTSPSWPSNLALHFAGTREVTAHYRAKGQDWPVTVQAPDYASEIEAQLSKFRLIATHILKSFP